MTLSCKTLSMTALAGALAIAPAARAAGGPSEAERRAMLEKAFGSTIVSTYPDGRQAQLWLERDGAYRMESRKHDHSDGHWQIKDDKLCLKQSHPIPAPFSFCTPAPATLDKPWTAKAVTGETIVLKLQEGAKSPTDPGDPAQKKASGDTHSSVDDKG